MVQERQSRFFPLAAGCRARLCLVLIWLAWLPCVQASRTSPPPLSPEHFTWLTSPLETRVGGPLPTWSGRLFSEGFLKLEIAPTYEELAYEIASGRRQWPNRDPIGIEGGINLYAYVRNNPISAFDPWGYEPIWYPDYNPLRPEEGPHNTDATVLGISETLAMILPGLVGVLFEPADWALTLKGIYDDPSSPWSWLPALPGIPAGVRGIAKRLDGTIDLSRSGTKPVDVGTPIPGADAARRVLTDAERALYDRVSHPAGFRRQVWDRSKAADGNVYDPSGRIMDFDEPWELGHRPGHKFSDAQLRAAEEGWDRQTWMKYQNDPDIYRPELPSTNAGHKWESTP